MIGNADFLATIAHSRQSELIAEADRRRVLALARRHRRNPRQSTERREAVQTVRAVSSPRAKHA